MSIFDLPVRVQPNLPMSNTNPKSVDCGSSNGSTLPMGSSVPNVPFTQMLLNISKRYHSNCAFC